jgi:hypothetical protein
VSEIATRPAAQKQQEQKRDMRTFVERLAGFNIVEKKRRRSASAHLLRDPQRRFDCYPLPEKTSVGFRRCQSSGVIFRFTSIIAAGRGLQGNEAAEVGVDCLVHHTHTTSAVLFKDAVARNGCGDHSAMLFMDRLIVSLSST